VIQVYHPDGRVIFLDAVESVQVSQGASVAQHPMESGAPASDHAEISQITLAMTAHITENPTEAQSSQEAELSLLFPERGLVTDVLANLSGPARVRAAVEFFQSCVGEYLEIVSGRFRYENCLISQFPHDWKRKQTSTFTLSFVKPRQVVVQSVLIPPRRVVPPAMADGEDGGPGGTEVPKEDISIFRRAITGAQSAGDGGSFLDENGFFAPNIAFP
jgi:hypothetical protein